jgi:thiosulfate dehydrogenase [quinone] large subunit
MVDSALERGLVLFFRIAMRWTFLYPGLTRVTDPNFTVASSLTHTKTLHDQPAPLAAPAIAPFTTFLVEWGHTLIGLSLILGLLVRVSSPFGVLLMAVYYCAHMDWPYIENHFNFIMDYHLVYGAVLIHLIATRAGHVWGLDSWAEKLPIVANSAVLRPLVG